MQGAMTDMARRKFTHGKYGRTFADRFWEKVEKAGPDECWLWMASTVGGYGIIGKDGGNVRAHRAVYELVVGPIPDDMHVLHRCDVPRCCNPAHLWIGTNADNVRDKTEKGRGNQPRGDAHSARMREVAARGDKHSSKTHPERVARGDRNGIRIHPELVRGESNGMAKLTDDDVIEIRDSVFPIRFIANKFRVCETSIRNIRGRKSWRHLP